MSFEFLGVGSPIVDYTASVSDDFLKRFVPGEKGGTVHINQVERDALLAELSAPVFRTPGGSAGNTVFALGDLGIHSSLLGKLGKDDDALFFRDEMRRRGVSDTELIEGADGSTGYCISLVTPDAERTMRSDLGVSASLTVDELRKIDLKKFDWVLVEGYMMELPCFGELLELIHKAGAEIALDLSSFELARSMRGILPDILKNRIDLLFANREEAEALTGQGDPFKALEIIEKYSLCAVIKAGENGSLIGVADSRFEIPAFSAGGVIDTTAAGDHYSAGFFYALSRNCGWEICGRCGALLAGEIICHTGSKLPDDSWTKIKAQLNREIAI